MQRILVLSILSLGLVDLASCGGGGDSNTGPPPELVSVTVSPEQLTLLVGQSQQLTATPRDQTGTPIAGHSISWSTSDETIATVSETGVVTAVAEGSATITATSEGKSGTASVSVTSVPVASVTVSPDQWTLRVGESQQFNATARDQVGNALGGRPIAWASSDATIATVSETGVVTGVAEGSVTITATSEGKSGTATVSVSAVSQVPVASVSVSPGELTFVKGGSQQFTATPQDQSGNPLAGRSITWTTSDASVATVSPTGSVSGVGVGTATITATSEGKSGSAVVSISVVTFTALAAGGAHTCALTADGAAYCWGRGESGQLGVPVPTTTCLTDAGPYPCSMTPVAVRGGIRFTKLAGGGAHTCGLTSNGLAYCWGHNMWGQLGDNSGTSQDAPVQVATGLRFAGIDAGTQHTCGLTSDGTAYCWGRNDRGQLGDGTTSVRFTPVPVAGNHSFRLVVAGGFDIGQTCGLTTDGVAYCWGDNERGQLGNGSGGFGKEDLRPHPQPGPVAGALTFDGLTAGLGRHTCGLTAAGGAYCWGENSFGALGDGSTIDRATPVPVTGGLAFVQVSAGGFIGHTCGRTAGGTAYCWGENSVGQVGDNSTIDRLEPAAVFGGHSFTLLDSGFRHTCGLATDGALYCWGSDGAGQLGIGRNSPRSVPSKVVGQP